jgi:transposase InsO family protein
VEGTKPAKSKFKK